MSSRRIRCRRFVLPVALSLCLLIIFAACTQSEESTATPTTVAEEEPVEEEPAEEEPTEEEQDEDEEEPTYPSYPCPVLDGFVLNSGLTQNGYVKNQIIIMGHPDAIDLIRP
ncbi:MAG: hypothetical protein GY805_29815, partial [Chloroflexi bacterium]|nr:hypothetical protein [Chloroflexota bacterium]